MHILNKYRCVIFGPSSFTSLPHRGQAIALELAEIGSQVDYIEFPPSMIGTARHMFDRFLRKSALETISQSTQLPEGLRVHTPPRMPASVRNSISPAIDKHIFRTWFTSEFANHDWEKTIVWIMMPLWWKWFIDETFLSPRLLVYDIADDLGVFSTSRYSLRRLQQSERSLANHIDMVTYSAGQMAEEVRTKFPGLISQFLPNAIGGPFKKLAECPKLDAPTKNVIGFVGIISDRWIDTPLLEKVARQYPDHELVIVGPMDAKNAQRFNAFPNVRLTGLLRHDEIANLVTTFQVALIPFKHNTITRVVNPLKLYEYAAAGLPIVAIDTEELQQYGKYIYLADSHDDFLRGIEVSLKASDPDGFRHRKEFALQNTWKQRILTFERMLGYAIS